MAVSFRYWDDCVAPQDLDTMWKDPEVKREWINAGEDKESKVHLSRDPDGHPYLTQIEMKAVAGIIVKRHYVSQIDSDMLCAIAELESDRQPLCTHYIKKSKASTMGIMQIFPKTAEWLVRDLGYTAYRIEDSNTLYKPFVNVYLGAAYLKWLSTYDHKERSEEFIVRAYRGGLKKANHKSTIPYWKRYLSVKESLPSRKVFDVRPMLAGSSSAPQDTNKQNNINVTWDSRASREDMDEMWNKSFVRKEWTKCGEKRGRVNISHDANKRPYVSRIEIRGVAEIILSKHFSTQRVKASILCAIAEIISMRYVNGVGQRPGLMGIDYPTAQWLYRDLDYKAYNIKSVEDLTRPFVSMYFGAAYMSWLANYEGRERSPQFIVQAYLNGPQNVNLKETGPSWLKFEEAISHYEDLSKAQGDCSIL